MALRIITVHLAALAAIAVMIEPPVVPAATAMFIIAVRPAAPGGYVNVHYNCDVD